MAGFSPGTCHLGEDATAGRRDSCRRPPPLKSRDCFSPAPEKRKAVEVARIEGAQRCDHRGSSRDLSNRGSIGIPARHGGGELGYSAVKTESAPHFEISVSKASTASGDWRRTWSRTKARLCRGRLFRRDRPARMPRVPQRPSIRPPDLRPNRIAEGGYVRAARPTDRGVASVIPTCLNGSSTAVEGGGTTLRHHRAHPRAMFDP
jgi:hypothetical protein